MVLRFTTPRLGFEGAGVFGAAHYIPRVCNASYDAFFNAYMVGDVLSNASPISRM